MVLNKKGYRHWDFPSGPPPQYQPSLKALNFGVRMGSGVFTLVWPITKLTQIQIQIYIQQIKSQKGYRHWDFPSGPPPQYQPSLKALNFGVRMGSGVFTLVWPITKLIKQISIQYKILIHILIKKNQKFKKIYLFFKITYIKKQNKIKKVIDTGTSQAVPHLSTNPALRRLTSEFEWDPVFSPQYGRQQNQQNECYRHWDFPSGPPPQYQPSLKALNFGVRMGSGVFTLVWPITKLIN
ncbi:MFS transporter (macronuclear) [Tetrahymena thermophila SB210]|uniref:MFS transporter n=1 Tax=Tetrahymena thermophila (strain SB210) TaxID=312017 RepID=W7X9D5_TETTS|nr:MFS transporter [Tetrahymena thermophila SB210]EWS73972.1 MFS transporter [Tetrahymena thermophila SB210]|eukprot:XP_012653513.1 MFS transporter [Tetrahymena thermophila SB210]